MPNPYAISWDETGDKLYETGVDRGVLYIPNASGVYDSGVSWNGLTAVNESPEGGDSNELYADNIKYADLVSAEKFGFTIECYTYPEEFNECNGFKELASGIGAYAAQQTRKSFGFCYRTLIGNDVDGTDKGYKLHLVYGCKAEPSDMDYETVNDSPDAIQFSFECKTTPVNVNNNFKPTSYIVIDSTKADATKLAALEQTLYGTPASGGTVAVAPALPTPAEVITALS